MQVLLVVGSCALAVVKTPPLAPVGSSGPQISLHRWGAREESAWRGHNPFLSTLVGTSGGSHCTARTRSVHGAWHLVGSCPAPCCVPTERHSLFLLVSDSPKDSPFFPPPVMLVLPFASSASYVIWVSFWMFPPWRDRPLTVLAKVAPPLPPTLSHVAPLYCSIAFQKRLIYIFIFDASFVFLL